MKATHHDILAWWCDVYRANIRITHDGNQFIYHAVDYLRIMHTKQFGLIEIAPLSPPASIVSEVRVYHDELLELLGAPVPPELAYWFYHPLTKDYEAVPLAAMAAKLGVAVYLEPCRLGMWPVVLPGVVAQQTVFSLPELSPILRNDGYSYFMDAYQIMERASAKRENGYNRVDDDMGPKVRKTSGGIASRNGSRADTRIARREG